MILPFQSETSGHHAFERFQNVIRDGSGPMSLRELLDQVLPLVPGLTERLEQGIEVLNAGCGRGCALNELARRFPYSRFIGYGTNESSIALARREATESQSGNIRFVKKDLTWFLDTDVFDVVLTFDGGIDENEADGIFPNIYRALRTPGIHVNQLSSNRSALSRSRLMSSSDFRPTITGVLQEQTGAMAPLAGAEIEKLERLASESGFIHFEVHEIDQEVHHLYSIARK